MIEPAIEPPVDFALLAEMRDRLMRAVSEPGRNPMTGAVEPNPVESMTALLSVVGLAIAAKVSPHRGAARKRLVTIYVNTIKKHVAEMLTAFDADEVDDLDGDGDA